LIARAFNDKNESKAKAQHKHNHSPKIRMVAWNAMLVWVFFSSVAIFLSIYISYLAYVRHYSRKPWNVERDNEFQPSVSILVPAHNEEATIERKMANLVEVSYPKSKIEIVVIDDASEDSTLAKIKNFILHNPGSNIKVVEQRPQAGKSAGLNLALKMATNSIIIVTDSDTFWSPDVLEKAMPFLADPRIGAVSGMGINENAGQSWSTRSEETYLNLTNMLRVGESKRHSTIRFEGGFCAFRKDSFKEFDCETGADDSGTALDVVQHNKRAILVPEVLFTTYFPTSVTDRVRIKTRRATQLISLWVKCLRLLFKKQLALPKSIVIPELLLFIVNPAIFAVSLAATLGLFIAFPFSWMSLFVLSVVAGLLIFARKLFLEVLVDNMILLYGLVNFLLGRRYVAWQTPTIETQ
jgi:cellulose synthase/poly-beta-1,6-N-acetylglucosamine synthase-like glycosyltransferase